MTRLELDRRIAADPASLALLLAGPAADGLWPHGADAPEVEVAGRLRAVPEPEEPAPSRAPTAFVSRFRLLADGRPAGTVTLTLGYADGGADLLATRARLRVDSDYDPAAVRAGAQRFLDRLAATAESRARVA